MKQRDHYIFYKDRPAWKDVTPVPQDVGGRNIVKIAYSPQFVDANDYLRAVLLKDERSERALELTSTVLTLNPANYTVWEYRRRILTSLDADLTDELKFVGKFIDETSKNYQLWHHRQWLVTRLAEIELKTTNDTESREATFVKWGLGELEFTKDFILDDPKNYHSWQHRRWAVDYFKLSPHEELTFTESLLNDDVYNNSAWNHRFVTVTKDEGFTPNVLRRELEFTQKMIVLAPDNESAWNYLYGLTVPTSCTKANTAMQLQSAQPSLASFHTSASVVDETSVPDEGKSSTSQSAVNSISSVVNLNSLRHFAEQLTISDEAAANSVALLGFLVEIYSDCIRLKQDTMGKGDLVVNGYSIDTSREGKVHGGVTPAVPDTSGSTPTESLSDLISLAVTTCERLATELDRIRAKYWQYRARQIRLLSSESVN